MDSSIPQLVPAFLRERASGSPLVLATIVATQGSTYRKIGAQLLITHGGEPVGLLSGGCLESDLVEQSRDVMETGLPRMLRYDDSADDNELFGLGIGCGGSIEVWLTRLDRQSNWEPFSALADGLEHRIPVSFGLVLESGLDTLPAGATVFADAKRPLPRDLPDPVARWLRAELQAAGGAGLARVAEYGEPRLRVFIGTLVLPRRLLIIGAGPDAYPLVDFAAGLSWELTIADHRPAYPVASRFPRANHLIVARPNELHRHVDLEAFDAAVVMSHQLTIDRAALETLSHTSIPYVGLLGPASRRQKLLEDIGEATERLGARLHAPVGLKLGGRDAASVALGIVAEIQAFFHQRLGEIASAA